MWELGKIHQLIIPFFGHNITLNLEVMAMTWIVFLILIGIGFLSVRKRGIFPKAMQMFGEIFVSQFYGLVEDALDKKMAKTYGIKSREIVDNKINIKNKVNTFLYGIENSLNK